MYKSVYFMKSESDYTTYAQNTHNKDGSISLWTLWNKIDNYIHDTIKKFYPAGVYVYNMIKKIDNKMSYFIILFIISLITYSFFKSYIHTLDILNAYQLEIAFAQYNPTLIRYHLYQQLLLYASEICAGELIDSMISSIADYWGCILDEDLQHRYIDTVAEQNIPKNIGNSNNHVAESVLYSIVTFTIETPHLVYQTYCLLLAHSYLIYPLLLLILGVSLIRGVISIYEKMIEDETKTTPKLHDFWNDMHKSHNHTVITAAENKDIFHNKMDAILKSKAHINTGRTIIYHVKLFIQQSIHRLGETILLLLQCEAYLTGRITLPELYANCRSILSIIYKAHRIAASIISIYKNSFKLEILHTTEQFIAAEKKARDITAKKWGKIPGNQYIFNIKDLHIHPPGDNNNSIIIETTIAKGKTYYIKELNGTGKSMLCKLLHGQILCLDNLEKNISSLFKSRFTVQSSSILQRDDTYKVFYRTARTYTVDDSILSFIISPLTKDKITQKEVNAIHTYFEAIYKESDTPDFILPVLEALRPKNADLTGTENEFSKRMDNALSISFSQKSTTPSTGTAQIIQGCGLYLALQQCTKPKLVILDESCANMDPKKQQQFVDIIYSVLNITAGEKAPQDTVLVIAHTENPEDNSHPLCLQERTPARLHIFKQDVETTKSLTLN